jgi:hypothetical protein
LLAGAAAERLTNVAFLSSAVMMSMLVSSGECGWSGMAARGMCSCSSVASAPVRAVSRAARAHGGWGSCRAYPSS